LHFEIESTYPQFINSRIPFSYIDLLDEYMKMHRLEKKVSLKNAIEQCGFVPSGISHAALDDAINTLSVLKTMIDNGWTLLVPS